MALKVGICGPPNSGKTFSRTFLTQGEKVFVIAPSAKAMKIKTSEGKAIKRLNPQTKTFEELYPGHSPSKVMKGLMKSDLTGKKFTGNYIIADLEDVETLLKFVNIYKPEINTIILPDFTHYISKVLASKSFIMRKSGGEGFQRFWELAGEVLENLMLSIDNLREDLIVVTEYHTEYDADLEEWVIFTPGGKMLTEKFKLESYYDYLLFTYVDKQENGIISPNDYKFITRRWKNYPARAGELFKETLINNNLQTVLDALRKENDI